MSRKIIVSSFIGLVGIALGAQAVHASEAGYLKSTACSYFQRGLAWMPSPGAPDSPQSFPEYLSRVRQTAIQWEMASDWKDLNEKVSQRGFHDETDEMLLEAVVVAARADAATDVQDFARLLLADCSLWNVEIKSNKDGCMSIWTRTLTTDQPQSGMLDLITNCN